MPEGVGNNLVTEPARRTPRRTRQPPPESFDPRRGPGGLDATPADQAAAAASDEKAVGGMAKGAAVIRAALKNVPAGPGVYRMLDRKGDAIYVGKARNLKARVQNYTHPLGLSNRTRRMVAETAALEIVVTQTEAEALLLECNMIKRLLPRFNVLLRDDKSFPLIHITAGHDFPQLTKHRGARADDGTYFGPFASAGAVTAR
jgi:excinuclease ABC subunit C